MTEKATGGTASPHKPKTCLRDGAHKHATRNPLPWYNPSIVLSWQNLAKSYGRRRLFEGRSGELTPACGLLVVGDNGSGKSTFLKILVGLVRPDVGSVNAPLSKNAIGYAAPHMAVYGELTGLENVRFFAEARGLRPSATDCQTLLDRLGLSRAANKSAATYSTGMTQRLKIACALIHEPDILVLDEPTIGLDRAGVELVEQVLAQHVGAGNGQRAAIVATNDASHFARFGWPSIAMGA